MNFRKHLRPPPELVLPFLGGSRVHAKDRVFRIDGALEIGWWRFAVIGRRATVKEKSGPLDLSERPRLSGTLLGDRLVIEGGRTERLHLLPEAEAPRFSPATARRWYDGSLIFEQVEFESGVEEEVRRALEDGKSLAELKAVSAPLRAAFSIALVDKIGRQLGLRASPLELRRDLATIAELGAPAAEATLRRLDAERRVHLASLARRIELDSLPTTAPDLPEIVRRSRPYDSFEARAEAALDAANARLRRVRRLGGTLVEVTFDFSGETFTSIVNEQTLQVEDSGICLSGADRSVTLESLPSVIREAIETDRLVITRHWD